MVAYIFSFVHFAFEIYYILIMANILLSWFPVVRGNAITVFIYEMTEPYLRIFRRMLPPSPRMPIDFSPIIAIFVLYMLESLVTRVLILLVL
ncbi:MAG: YggT family protein [Firmicutes bacterium]|nr:YggT family protein [Bacillota bacterium]